MRKRRRTKYVWLPSIPSDIIVGTRNYARSPIEFSLTVWQDGTPGIVIFPLTSDDTPETTITSTTLMGDVIGNEYVLKRIVGKLFATYDQTPVDAVAPTWPAVILTAGFFVARAETEASSAQPIGITTGLTVNDFDNYNPQAEGTHREPWIWRRSWILADRSARDFTTYSNGVQEFPTNTAGYSSVADGPHIDARTIRRVRQDNRLWFAAGATAWIAGNGGTTPAADSTIRGVLDYRLLGALRKARSSGSF